VVNGATPVAEGAVINLSIGTTGVANLSLSNAGTYNSVEWFFNGASRSTTATYTITAGTANYNVVGRYPVTVVGTTPAGTGPYDGSPFSVEFFVVIEP
jgi:hypothetical protein